METGDLAHADGTAPPGEYLEEVIRKLGLSKNELARRMNRPAAKLSAIFKGTKAITPVTALQLEKVVGVDARVWTGLEADYRLALARAREVEDWDRLVEEGLRVGRFPYAGLAELGWVEPKSRLGERVMELQRFFGVTSLRNLSAIRLYACGMRRVGSGEGRASPEAVAAWLRIGELNARQVRCAPFKRTALKKAIRVIRSMPPDTWEGMFDACAGILAGCGVALVPCPELPDTGVHGATFWMGKARAVAVMPAGQPRGAVFRAGLFHKLGHLLLHRRQNVCVECGEGVPESAEAEREADRFAADTMVPADV